uniref:N-acetylgalactosaminide beta-1,3-galactosyltransferase n=1 Tax=Rhabditophanes sp. KR3021 TaxID=114890 RepID=A0AC35U5S7_9BILA
MLLHGIYLFTTVFSIIAAITNDDNYDLDEFEKNNDFNNFSMLLQERVKVFCIILTTPKNKYSRVIPQINTWVKRCSNWVYASSVDDPSIKAIKAFPSDDYRFSYGKIRGAIQHVYAEYKDTFDYILKIDDDSFIVMENLRMFLLNKNASEEKYFGYRLDFNSFGHHNYHQGGAGYVLSIGAIKKLVNEGFSNPNKCFQGADSWDDREIGHCMENMNIDISDVKDFKGRIVFTPSSVVDFTTLNDNHQFNFFCSMNAGGCLKENLSTFPISFHYISADMQYALEYLFYKAKIIGQNKYFIESLLTCKDGEICTDEIEKIQEYSRQFYP